MSSPGVGWVEETLVNELNECKWIVKRYWIAIEIALYKYCISIISILAFPLIALVDNCEYEDIYFSTIMIFSRYPLQFDWESRAEIKAKKEAT